MAEHASMLGESVGRLLADYAAGAKASTAAFDPALWAQVEAQGVPLLLFDEAAGGAGASWSDAYPVVYALGAHGTPAPVAEAMLAARLLGAAGLPVRDASMSLAPLVQGELRHAAGGLTFSGTLHAVPWGADVEGLVAVLTVDGRPHVLHLRRDAAAGSRRAPNVAGEPRDDFRFESARVDAAACDAPEALDLPAAFALLRVAQIAGALDSALGLAIDYARQRKQFGRPIGQFQAIQQSLAQFGAEAAAVDCAGRAAFRALAHGEASFQIACAKLRANQAVGVGAATAHQVHGAIGFTHEYTLRRFTQRLWSWRSEGGNDRYWSDVLGSRVARAGAEAFWPQLTARDDAVGS